MLVLLDHALAIVLAPRTLLQVALFALAALDQLVCSLLEDLCLAWMLTVMADACTCEKASDGGIVPSELETDFTTKA